MSRWECLPHREKGHCQRWNQQIPQCNSLCNNAFLNDHKECLEHQAFYTRKMQHCRPTPSMPLLVSQPRPAKEPGLCSRYTYKTAIRAIQNLPIQMELNTTTMVMVASYLESDVLSDKERWVHGERSRVEGAHGIAFCVRCLCCVSPFHYCCLCSFSFYCYEWLHWGYVHLLPTPISPFRVIIVSQFNYKSKKNSYSK